MITDKNVLQHSSVSFFYFEKKPNQNQKKSVLPIQLKILTMKHILWSWNGQLMSLSWVKISQLLRGKETLKNCKGYAAKFVSFKKNVLNPFLLHHLTLI